MRRRMPRRQGVVYGPLAHREYRQESSGVGRLLGGVVVIGAAAMLGIGGLAFLGAAEFEPASPTPPPGAVVSPTPVATPAPIPTPPPVATPMPTATPEPIETPQVTPIPVEVREGAGHITFGSDYRTNPGRIVDASATFGTSGQLAWLADFGGRAGTTTVQIEVHRIDEADGSETLTYQEDFSFRSGASVRFLRRISDIGDIIDGPGVYVVRYLVGGETRAEGFFRAEEN